MPSLVSRVRRVAVALLLGSLAVGPALAQDTPAPQPPPPPRVESPSPSPGPDAVWIAGHWIWQDGAWQWVGGRWEQAQGRSYVPGRYRQTPRGWVWEPGHWR